MNVKTFRDKLLREKCPNTEKNSVFRHFSYSKMRNKIFENLSFSRYPVKMLLYNLHRETRINFA